MKDAEMIRGALTVLCLVVLVAILCLLFDIRARLDEANGQLQLIQEGQAMTEEEWIAYCEMYPEDCEETF